MRVVHLGRSTCHAISDRGGGVQTSSPGSSARRTDVNPAPPAVQRGGAVQLTEQGTVCTRTEDKTSGISTRKRSD